MFRFLKDIAELKDRVKKLEALVADEERAAKEKKAAEQEQKFSDGISNILAYDYSVALKHRRSDSE